MSNRRLLGERVAVRVAGCAPRDGVLISGVKKQTKLIQKFHVRFPNGDVRTHRGDQILLRGSKAVFTEFVRVGDVVFTKNTLGVVRFVGKHEEFLDWLIVLEPMDPKLPPYPKVESFRKLFPSANLSDQNPYTILTKADEILKMLPPDIILKQISNIKDKYLAFLEDRKEQEKQNCIELMNADSRIVHLEEFQAQLKERIHKMWRDCIKTDSGQVAHEYHNAPPEARSVSLTFKPGRLGINAVWAKGEVRSVSEDTQADHLGIEPGWRITHVDNEPYSEELVDAHTEGINPYTLTFEIPPDPDDVSTTSQAGVQQAALPTLNDMHNIWGKNDPNGASARPELGSVAREEYEQKIRELNAKIEESQELVTALKAKNTKLEEDHKELTRLRVKSQSFRNSRVLFQSQIKVIQNRGKEWRKKAMEFGKKYQKLLDERGRVEAKNNKHSKWTASPTGTEQALSSKGQKNVEQGPKPQKPKARGRKPSKMPMPEPGNTLSLKGVGTSTGQKGRDKSKKRKKRASWFKKEKA